MFLRDTLRLSDLLTKKDQEQREDQGECTDCTKQPETSGKADLVCSRKAVEPDIERVDCGYIVSLGIKVSPIGNWTGSIGDGWETYAT